MAVRRAAVAAASAAALSLSLLATSCSAGGTAAAAESTPPAPAKKAVATGSGGAVSSVNPYASRAGLEVLRKGGNAVDAAVATAAALGVVEPYSAGVGGGGYMVYYDAKAKKVRTIDGRETAPAAMRADSFLDKATGKPLPTEDAINSGLSVGVPGTPATWDKALKSWGTVSLAKALRPATRIADDGFVVNKEFRAQTAMNEKRFRDIKSTSDLFLPKGELPVVGSRFRNPDLARTYRQLAGEGVDALYHGSIGRDVARTVQKPPMAPGAHHQARPGLMKPGDLARYTTERRDPTRIKYHGLDVYSMAPSSSGGTTVGEALNILDNFHLSKADKTQALHHYLEASRISFADRNRWVGDPAFSDVPTKPLLAKEFAKSRACLIRSDKALTSPLAPADPRHPDAGCQGRTGSKQPHEGPSTTHLVAADRWGNVVSYTLTIEQTGGSAITVPGRGFLLNNELTDFDFAPLTKGTPDPNLPGPGKRPRSSMSPTIVLRDGKPMMAVGSPGGATIITTVLQTLVNRLDLGMSLPAAVAAPRISQRNAAQTEAEPAFLDSPERKKLEALGHRFVLAPKAFTPSPEIGAVAALEFLPGGKITAVAEPKRRGGGSAMVLHESR
ncbi:gamma-glutamyltranspeptidase / glutathione hydrolase [Streptomyces sp. 2323.1]|uniref:gamma-glutamyltransferase n=1 Tax=Streptomyces sp. 2323.1 TaxID=1938841 RepID=UPI000BB884BC|nr:gamma-glutamyltransferase [Streptomyces sp. 2323.1]SOE15753.1 gamma-glutamyltranspeptidase / glutathione hydrolase [Streptomyces sp. 2323.1]